MECQRAIRNHDLKNSATDCKCAQGMQPVQCIVKNERTHGFTCAPPGASNTQYVHNTVQSTGRATNLQR